MFRKTASLTFAFIGALIVLWSTWFLYPNLQFFGIVELHGFLKKYLGDQPAIFAVIMHTYIYFAMIVIGNIIPVVVFSLFGLVLSRSIQHWWSIIIFASGLVLFNLPRLIFDTFFGFPDRFDLTGVMMFLSLSYLHPLIALGGWWMGRRPLKGVRSFPLP